MTEPAASGEVDRWLAVMVAAATRLGGLACAGLVPARALLAEILVDPMVQPVFLSVDLGLLSSRYVAAVTAGIALLLAANPPVLTLELPVMAVKLAVVAVQRAIEATISV